MGTNYYTATQDCPSCGKPLDEERRHLGKSSAGWHFALRVDPENGIRDIADVLDLARRHGVVDEYGRNLSTDEFMKIVMVRFTCDKPSMGAEWYLENQAEPGFMGLARARIDERCIGHGDGPWSYFVGDFS